MSDQSNSHDLPRWVYLLGVVSILFVIYVWRAPLDWFTEFLADWFTSGLPSEPPPTTAG